MDKSNIIYTLHVNNLLEKISSIEEALKQNFNICFIAYDQNELKIAFNRELSDDEETQLMNIVYKSH